MICYCSLAGTFACQACMRRQGYVDSYTWGIPDIYGNNPFKQKRITEKYDANGKLIERIIEE